jgi:hypothetical protein
MTTITFDSDQLVTELEATGIPGEQARAFVRAIIEAQTDLATKRDIEDLRRDMREMEQRLIIKLGAMMVVAIGIVAALVKLL